MILRNPQTNKKKGSSTPTKNLGFLTKKKHFFSFLILLQYMFFPTFLFFLDFFTVTPSFFLLKKFMPWKIPHYVYKETLVQLSNGLVDNPHSRQ